jgi:hypothetical protein
MIGAIGVHLRSCAQEGAVPGSLPPCLKARFPAPLHLRYTRREQHRASLRVIPGWGRGRPPGNLRHSHCQALLALGSLRSCADQQGSSVPLALRGECRLVPGGPWGAFGSLHLGSPASDRLRFDVTASNLIHSLGEVVFGGPGGRSPPNDPPGTPPDAARPPAAHVADVGGVATVD